MLSIVERSPFCKTAGTCDYVAVPLQLLPSFPNGGASNAFGYG